MAAKKTLTQVNKLLGNIDFQAAGFTKSRVDQVKQVCRILFERGPLDGATLADELEVLPNTLRDCVLSVGWQVGLLDRDDRFSKDLSGRKPSLWSFSFADARRLQREHPVAPLPPTLDVKQVREQLNNIHYLKTGLTTVQANRVLQVAVKLTDGPLDTKKIEKFLGLNYSDTTATLNRGRQLAILQRERRYTGRKNGKPGGQLPALWSLDTDGILAFPESCTRKPCLSWPVSLLPASVREQIEAVHFAKDDLSETQAWWIANFIAMIRLAGGVLEQNRDEIGWDYGLQPGTLRRHIKTAVERNYIVLERPGHKGKRIRPKNVFRVNEEKLESRRDGTAPARPLSPGRTLVSLRDLWPKTERWTSREKKIVEKIDRRIAGLSKEQIEGTLGMTAEQWRYSRPILAAVGTKIQSKYRELALELGCSRGQLEKQIGKMKRAGWFSVKLNTHGRATQASDYAADWDKLAAIAGVKKNAGVNRAKQSNTRTGAKKKTVTNAPKPSKLTKGRRGPSRDFPHLRDWLHRYLRENPDAKPADVRSHYRRLYPDRPLPSPKKTTLRSTISKVRSELKKSATC